MSWRARGALTLEKDIVSGILSSSSGTVRAMCAFTGLALSTEEFTRPDSV